MDKHSARKLNRILLRQKLRATFWASLILLFVVGQLVFAFYLFSPESAETATGVVRSWTLVQSKSGTAPMIVRVELPDQSVVHVITDRQRLAPSAGQVIELDRVTSRSGRVFYRWRRDLGLDNNSGD